MASTAKDYATHLSARVAVERFTVPLRRLDDFALADATAIKLDAEGAEYEILRAAIEQGLEQGRCIGRYVNALKTRK